jgi:hypothetical protein
LGASPRLEWRIQRFDPYHGQTVLRVYIPLLARIGSNVYDALAVFEKAVQRKWLEKLSFGAAGKPSGDLVHRERATLKLAVDHTPRAQTLPSLSGSNGG